MVNFAANQVVVTAKTDWDDIPYAIKFVWCLSLLMIVSAVAVFVRPNNPSSNYLLREYGVEPTFVVLILFVAGILMPLVYKMRPNLNAIMGLSLPGVLVFASLVIQVSQSRTAPLLHLIAYGGLIAFIALSYSLVLKLDATQAANVELAKELQAVRQASKGG